MPKGYISSLCLGQNFPAPLLNRQSAFPAKYGNSRLGPWREYTSPSIPRRPTRTSLVCIHARQCFYSNEWTGKCLKGTTLPLSPVWRVTQVLNSMVDFFGFRSGYVTFISVGYLLYCAWKLGASLEYYVPFLSTESSPLHGNKKHMKTSLAAFNDPRELPNMHQRKVA